MRINDIRKMNYQDMGRELESSQQELFNLRFQREVGQLENQQRIVQTKRDVARLMTVMREEIKG